MRFATSLPIQRAPAAAETACREFLAAHKALDDRLRDRFWVQQAQVEEERQLEELSRALPRGRIAPQLLDTFLPAEVGISETVFRRLIGALGAEEGLREAVLVREAVLSAMSAAGIHSPAGFALQRLDRRLQDLLSLFFDPGILRVERITQQSAPEVTAAADFAARVVLPGCPSLLEGASSHRRCFALRHPFSSAPLLLAHASLLPAAPGTLAEAVGRPAASAAAPEVACLWFLGPPGSGLWSLQGLRGLGLEQQLRQRSLEALRAELRGEVLALVPLSGLRSWLLAGRPWENRGLSESQEAALKRAATGSSARTELRFVDADSDDVWFQKTPEGLLVSMSGAAAKRVLRLRVVGRDVRFLLEGGEALQVSVSEEVAASVDLAQISEMAEASGILPAEARDTVLELAREYLISGKGGQGCLEPAVDFQLRSGAALRAFHWRADESRGLSDCLGVVVSLLCKSPEEEEVNAESYARFGTEAASAGGSRGS